MLFCSQLPVLVELPAAGTSCRGGPKDSRDVLCLAPRNSEAQVSKASRGFNRWDLVTILPGAVFGPPLSARKSGESVGMLQASFVHRTSCEDCLAISMCA